MMSESSPVRAVLFLILAIMGMVTLVSLVIRGGSRGAAADSQRSDYLELVEALRITDLALWTEARYLRHPSQADGFTAFQSSPAALDHFVSGMWVSPPPRSRGSLPDGFEEP